MIINRLLWAVPYVWATVTLLFFLFSIAGDDPAKMLAGQRSDLQTLESIRAELGLDRPVYVQYFLYLNDLSPVGYLSENQKATGNYTFFSIGNSGIVIKYPYLRRSFQNRTPVAELFLQKLPGTLLLAFSSMTLAVVIGISLGVAAAAYPRSMAESVFSFFALTGVSLPSYVAAVFAAWWFGIVLHEYTGLNPSGYWIDQNPVNGENVYNLSYLILPALTLGIRPLSIIYQLTRQSVSQVLESDFIRTARAKGVPPFYVYFRHALRNALQPVVTSVSIWFGTLLTGAYFIEYIFNWEGIGKLTIEALAARDYPMLLGSAVYTALIFIFTGILADILNGLIDPRIRTD